MHIPKFGRRALFYDLEHANKRGEAGETGLQGGFRDGYLRINEQSLRMLDSFFIQVFVKRIAGKILEQSGEVILAESDKIRRIIEGHVFRAVFLNILTDIDELCGVFFLFSVRDIRLDPFAGVLPADQYEHFQQFVVNGGA